MNSDKLIRSCLKKAQYRSHWTVKQRGKHPYLQHISGAKITFAKSPKNFDVSQRNIVKDIRVVEKRWGGK